MHLQHASPPASCAPLLLAHLHAERRHQQTVRAERADGRERLRHAEKLSVVIATQRIVKRTSRQVIKCLSLRTAGSCVPHLTQKCLTASTLLCFHGSHSCQLLCTARLQPRGHCRRHGDAPALNWRRATSPGLLSLFAPLTSFDAALARSLGAAHLQAASI